MSQPSPNHSKSIERTLFEGALGLSDPDERRAFLDQTCQGNPALREKLEKLLNNRDRAEDFFDVPPVKMPAGVTRMAVLEGEEGAPSDQATALGNACIGRYKLLERMGEGGCGVVYRAEQLEPVRRMVALKIIRLGMDTEGVIARFEMERQALALMDHPNIARVLDAGATSTGRSFFVMELVEGEKITDFCDRRRLDVGQRLELFIQICLAIQHAHQKGIIHRDIKPSNVLVRLHDGVPVPKVIDFGIAKATAADFGENTTFTAFDKFLGTPAYMSPEQASGSGQDVDTRSDIYSLGALLHELLTGHPPFDPTRLQKAGLEEMRRIVQEEEPPVPSAKVASLPAEVAQQVGECRSTDPHKLAQHLKGDLDWIVMKAMEKDRQRRYATVQGLATDVQRHLRHEPVNAGPPGRRYRLRKLVRRNKVAFTAGSLVVIALTAGFGTSTWRYFREKEARREADHARANESMLRERAEFREALAQAAVKIQHGDLAGADALMAGVPVEQTPSSLEAANSFLAVGEWHVRAGRWEVAADRFASLARAMTSVDPSDSDNVSRHLLPAAATLCQSGDRERYEWFRQMAIERFAGTSKPVVAEQVVKAALLLPADQQTLAALKPLSKITERAVETGEGAYGSNQDLIGWSYFALTLLSYREGNHARAAKWAERCLAVPSQNSSRETSVRILLAMIAQHEGKADAARVLLDAAEATVRERFSRNMQVGMQTNGLWFDWVNARILLREAIELIGE
jgi:serine/threonine protein kinase